MPIRVELLAPADGSSGQINFLQTCNNILIDERIEEKKQREEKRRTVAISGSVAGDDIGKLSSKVVEGDGCSSVDEFGIYKESE